MTRPMNTIRNARGTSTLEFAVVLPLLLFMMFAIVELSRAWLTLNLVTTAAREAARVGSVAPAEQFPNPPAAMARINDILNGTASGSSVTCSVSPCAPDAIVQATVSISFQTAVPLILPMLQTLNIQQTATMRYE
jgi:Flp pilus assembly protein TadG